MPYSLPNLAAAGFPEQAELHEADLAILAAAHARFGLDNGCAVTAQATPDMTVAVAAGTVIVAGVRVTVTAGNVTLTADATNPRYGYIEVDSAGVLSANLGVAAANPVKPAPTTTRAVLAEIFIPAADTAIQSNQIVDKRSSVAMTAQFGDLLVCPSNAPQAVKDAVLVAGGRVLTGTADQTLINAATLEASSLAGRSVVRMLAGLITIDAPIETYEGISLFGSGHYATVIQAASTFPTNTYMVRLQRNATGVGTPSTVTSSHEMTEVAYFKIDGRKATATAVGIGGLSVNNEDQTGMFEFNDPTHFIHDLYIRNCTGTGYFIDGRGGSMSSRIRIVQCDGYGLHVDGIDSFFDTIDVGGCGANTDTSAGIYATNADNFFVNCKSWYSKGHGFLQISTTSRSVFTNCVAQDNRRHGFKILGTNNQYSNCRADSNGFTDVRSTNTVAVVVGATTIDLASGASFRTSGTGYIVHAGAPYQFRYTGRATNQLTGVTWPSTPLPATTATGLTVWDAVDISSTGVASWDGFHIAGNAGPIMLYNCLAIDKNESNRGKRQQYGFGTSVATKRLTLHGSAAIGYPAFANFTAGYGTTGIGSWVDEANVVVVDGDEVAGITSRAIATADQSVVSSTVLVDSTFLKLTLGGVARYIITGYLLTDGIAAGDIKLQWTGPADIAGGLSFFAQINTATTNSGAPFYTITAKDTAVPRPTIGAGTTMIIPVFGHILVTTSGIFKLQFAQNTADATATRLLTGSWLKAERMS